MKIKHKILTLALAVVLMLSFLAPTSAMAAEKKVLIKEKVKIIEVTEKHIRGGIHLFNWDHDTRVYNSRGNPILLSKLHVPCIARISYDKSDARIKLLKEIRVIKNLPQLRD